MSKIKININIAGRTYPLSIPENEEEVLRKAGKQVNEMIKDFEKKYAINDKQDVLSMIALQLASKTLLKSNLDQEETKKISKVLSEWEEKIDHTLSN